jgi:hypothetical protein
MPKKVTVTSIPAPKGIGAALVKSLAKIKQVTGPRAKSPQPKNIL